MDEELWKKVHHRLFPEDYQTSNNDIINNDIVEEKVEESSSEPESISHKDSISDENTAEETPFYIVLSNLLNSIDFSIESLLNQESALYRILQKGIFSGFLHLILLVFSLGIISSYIFTIPAWFCGMIAGFFAGKKSGDMSRAIVSSILLFLIAYLFFTLYNLGLFPPISNTSIEDTHTFSISVFEWLLGGIYDFGGISGLVNPSSSLFVSSLCFSIFGSYVEIFKIPIKTES